MYRFSNVYLICAFASIGPSPVLSSYFISSVNKIDNGFPLGGALFGFDISSMSGVLGSQAYKRFFNNPSPHVQGGITAAMPAGSLLGSLGSSALADRLSRRTALQVGCALWIVGSAIQCAANGVVMLCVGRAVAGVCVGIASSVVPVYQVSRFCLH